MSLRGCSTSPGEKIIPSVPESLLSPPSSPFVIIVLLPLHPPQPPLRLRSMLGRVAGLGSPGLSLISSRYELPVCLSGVRSRLVPPLLHTTDAGTQRPEESFSALRLNKSCQRVEQ